MVHDLSGLIFNTRDSLLLLFCSKVTISLYFFSVFFFHPSNDTNFQVQLSKRAKYENTPEKLNFQTKAETKNFFCLNHLYHCYLHHGIETPEPPKSCELRNDTIMEVVCVAGYDGGLTQHFLLEVVGGNPIYSTEVTRVGQDIIDNEISTMNDQAIIFFYFITKFLLIFFKHLAFKTKLFFV